MEEASKLRLQMNVNISIDTIIKGLQQIEPEDLTSYVVWLQDSRIDTTDTKLATYCFVEYGSERAEVQFKILGNEKKIVIEDVIRLESECLSYELSVLWNARVIYY